MNPGMTRWNGEPLYPNPLDPVHSSLKFWTVLGTVLPYKPISIRPEGCPSTVMSKNTVSVTSAVFGPKNPCRIPPIIPSCVAFVFDLDDGDDNDDDDDDEEYIVLLDDAGCVPTITNP
jgi:hypothetical protein